MTTDPYDQATDEAFDQIISPYRHPGGRTVKQDATKTAEDKRAQAWQMLGCGGMLLCIALSVAVVTLAWRL